MSGKGPAVMKGPPDHLAAFFQVRKQQFQVNIIPMNVVEPDHIGIVFPDPIQKLPGCLAGIEAMAVRQPVQHTVDPVIQRGSDAHSPDIVTARHLPAIGNGAFMSLLLQSAAGLRHDAAGTAHSCYRVDEEVLHTIASFP